MSWVGYSFLETTITGAGGQAWAVVETAVRPGAYRMLVRCEQAQAGPESSAWRIEAVQGNRDLSGIAAVLSAGIITFDAVTTDSDTTPLAAWVDLGAVTLPPRAGTLTVPGQVPVPLGIRATRLNEGSADALRVDAIVLLAVSSPHVHSTESAVVEISQTVASGDPAPQASTETALVLDSDLGLSWIQSEDGVQPGIPGVRGTFPRLIPGYDNVVYLLHQTGARTRALAADFVSDDPDAEAVVEITYTPAYTFNVTTDAGEDDDA